MLSQSFGKELTRTAAKSLDVLAAIKGNGKVAQTPPFGILRVMGTIESLGCNWWKNMHRTDA